MPDIDKDKLADLEKRIRSLEDERRDWWTTGKYLRDERIPAFTGPDVLKDAGGADILVRRISDLDRRQVTLANGQNHNVSLASAVDGIALSNIRLAGPTAAFTTTGFAGPGTAQLLLVFNAVAFEWTIENEDLGSTDVNRIFTCTGADVVLRAGNSAAIFLYDEGGINRWILMAYNG